MRDYAIELSKRVSFIQKALKDSGCTGIVYGNSGGKDSVLVGILCRKACENTVGIIMPCQSSRNYGEDRDDALAVAAQFDIKTLTVDLTDAKAEICKAISQSANMTEQAVSNIAPRLRMTTVYAVAQSRNSLVAGTGNRSEIYMGYFTKWGDGAYDLNPIADLTVEEIYEFLRFLGAPANIIEKAPSAGLFEGQTDEAEMGVSYAAIDRYLKTGEGEESAVKTIERAHRITEHKRRPALVYSE